MLRSASHSGDWYTANPTKLDQQLDKWLSEVDLPTRKLKAVIAPHAGYAYSGPTAAWAYKPIDTTVIKTVFILGPSHHVYLDGCALSPCDSYATPIGDLPIDKQIVQELKDTNQFEIFSKSQDEDEHSLEMHLPYIRKVFTSEDIKIVPIVVGAINTQKEKEYGKVLAPYLTREDTFFVVSSDFCHWGTRFSYTFYYPSPEADGVRLGHSILPSPTHAIHESIRRLDHEAIDILQSGEVKTHDAFSEYLRRTKNTICGRHPIGVLLGALAASGGGKIEWVRYKQSSECETLRDSSVSYASGLVSIA
ncbi:hypothetical protein Moror_15273 [Moniliophthora roreri MCA 2997]|uniref:Uncharacterized protein n=2 Tax=Moniliophthora roreri TaxID=221103 RepID=V2X549_MONRO|nr:hypothetical protein Moror_15273 [Moniliophthora roreri MCA 2997]